jgi:4-amino-4-deoxy-L-arabinose transferase-like glycosyltransferase
VSAWRPPDRAARLAAPALALAGLAFLAAVTLSTISAPGLQYDEALFVNAALGGDHPHQGFIEDEVGGVPTLLMPYIGALKAWLYFPVFELFGVSPGTVRAPMVAAALAAVALVALLAWRLFGAWAAAGVALLLATDPAFATMTKADWGPVALSALLRAGALLAFFSWVRTGRARWAWALVACLSLGLFNKLDFALFAVGLGVAALVVHARPMLRHVRAAPLPHALAGTALAAVLVAVWVFIARPASELDLGAETLPAGERIEQLWTQLTTTFDSSVLVGYMTDLPSGEGTFAEHLLLPVLVAAAALALWGAVAARRAPATDERRLEPARVAGTLVVIAVVMVAGLALTPEATGPHHAILLWPLPQLAAVTVVVALARVPRPRVALAAAGAAAAVLAALVVSQAVVALDQRSTFAAGRSWSPIWSTEIYTATEAVAAEAPRLDAVVATDWGVGNQLFALGGEPVRARFADQWAAFVEGADPAARQAIGEAHLRGKRTAVVLHVPGQEIMEGTTANTERWFQSFAPRRGIRELYRGRQLLAYVVDDRA